jgi:hypothetical protein
MKKVSYISVLFFLVKVLPVSPASAQSLYLSPGQNAISLSTSFSTNNRMSGFRGLSSFSMNGLIDVGLGVGHWNIAEKVLTYDVSAFDIQPYLIFCIYKSKGEGFPVSLATSLTYNHYDYLNPVLDAQKTTSFVGNYYSFDVMGYGTIFLSENTFLQPMVSLGYLSGNSELVDKAGKVFSIQYYSSVIGTAVDVVIQPAEEYLYHIRPSLTLSRETPTLALAIGVVFLSVE